MKKTTMRKILSLVLALVLVAALAACSGGGSSSGGGTPNTSTGESNAPDTSSGGAVRDDVVIQVYGDAGTLDPIRCHQILGMHAVRASFYESLWCTGYWTENGEQIETERAYQLAESMEELSETEILVHLRQGVTFSNGNPFTADDVLFTMKLYYDSTQFQYVENVDFDKTEIIDDYTIKIVFKSYNFEQIGRLNSMYIFDEESYDETSIVTNPVGTGAYVMDEYVSGSHITAHAREDYWGGEPTIKKITFKIINEESQATNAYETGEVDVLALNPTADIDHLASLPNTKQIRLSMPTCTMIRFNMSENSVMANKDARYAVMYATDLNAINAIAFGGLGTLPQCIIPMNVDNSDPAFADTTQIYKDLANGPNYELAQEYAEKAGIVGETLRLINDGTPMFASACEIIQTCLGKIGVNVEIITYDAGSYKEKYADLTTWDMFPSEHSNPTNASYPLATRILTANKVGWSGPVYDEVVGHAWDVVGEFDPEKRHELMLDYLVELQDYSPAFNIGDNVKVYTYNSNLQGVEIFRMHDFLVKDWSWAS